MFWNCDFLPSRAISIWTGKEKACYEREHWAWTCSLTPNISWCLKKQNIENISPRNWQQETSKQNFENIYLRNWQQETSKRILRIFSPETGSRRLQGKHWRDHPRYPWRCQQGDYPRNHDGDHYHCRHQYQQEEQGITQQPQKWSCF